MKSEVIAQKLQQNKIVYIKDDYEQVVIRIVPNVQVLVYAKFKGKKEYLIDPTAKLVFDTQMGGEEITKEEYDKY